MRTPVSGRAGSMVVLIVVLACGGIGRAASGPTPAASVLYRPLPIVVELGEFDCDYEYGTVTDVEVADFDGDNLSDVAVTWYADDVDVLANCQRWLTIFRNDGQGLERWRDIDLFVPDFGFPAESVFRYGTSEMAVGDFDGDNDLDLAVAAFFGDELWFIENQGGGAFTGRIKYPFGSNSAGNHCTSPEMRVADFDGDGRDDLAVISDAILRIMGRHIHFWRTSTTLAAIKRVDWQALDGMIEATNTYGLAVADFSGDDRPDLCYVGTRLPPDDGQAILTTWYDLNVGTKLFSAQHEFPTMPCSDVLYLGDSPESLPGLILAGADGCRVQYWQRSAGGLDWQYVTQVAGYSGLSTGKGMAAVAADVDGDGDLDLVTKQKAGWSWCSKQIELTLRGSTTGSWTRIDPAGLIDTTGLAPLPGDSIMRPRNLAVHDLFGNRLPEVVAGFGPRFLPPSKGRDGEWVLEIAVWMNSTFGDVNRDGRTDAADVGLACAAVGACVGDACYNPHADLDHDGSVSVADLCHVADDFGAGCADCAGITLGDMNCDGEVTFDDMGPFSLAVGGRAAYEAEYPECNWVNGDHTGDGRVTFEDIKPFGMLFGRGSPEARALLPPAWRTLVEGD